MLNIYKASAGSGKTYRLTLEYIKLLLTADNDNREPILLTEHKKNHSHILAITFTNKATEEMKSRIIKELALLADLTEKSNYRKDLREHYHTDDESVARAAKVALYDLLFNYTYFNVSTIDSFFQQVLRTFAQDIDRPDNFEVSLDDEYILTIAVNRIFDQLGEADNATIKEWVKKSIDIKIDEGGKFNIFNRKSSIASEIVSTLKGLMNEDYRINSEIIDGYLSNIKRIKDFEEVIRKKRNAILDKWTKDIDYILNGTKLYGIDIFFKKNTLFESIKRGKIDSKCRLKDIKEDKDIEKEFFTKSKKSDGKTLKRTNAVPQKILDDLANFISNFDEEADIVFNCNAILRNIYTMGLLGVATKEMKNYCRNNDIILISDTNDVLGKIIGHEPAPFIYERMGVYLHHFLIDEFQDTSKMQWDNMLPLVIESLSKRYENLIIGDEKQCIYRFRNSNPELLGNEAEDFIGKLFGTDSVKVIGNKISENTNWRSAPAVIRFNNTLFYMLGLQEDFGKNAYNHVIQAIPEKNENTPGYVRLEFIGNEEITGAEDGADTKTAIDIANEHLKKDLTILIAEKGYRPKDIAILVDKNKQAEKIVSIIEELKNESDNEKIKNLQVIVNDALTLSSSSAVKIVINTLKLIIKESRIKEEEEKQNKEISSSENKTSGKKKGSKFKNTELNFLRFSTLLETFLAEGTDEQKAFFKAYKEKDTQSNYKNDNGRESNDGIMIDSENVGTTIDHIISALPEQLLEKENLFVSAFVDAVIDYSEHSEQDIISFLNWWEETGKYKKVSFPEGTDSITVSTIHKSKGLEFKVVLIPYTNWNFYEASTPSKPKREWMKIKYGGDIFKGIDAEIIPPMLPIEITSDLERTIFREAFLSNQTQQRVDQLNKTYVAFTRAKNVLIVYVPEPKKKNSESISEILKKTIKEMIDEDTIDKKAKSLSADERKLLQAPILFPSKDNPQKLEIGTLPSYQEIEEEKKDVEKKKTEQKKMPVYKSYDLSKKFTEYFKPVKDDSFDPKDAREKGTFLHNVLCDIEEPEDLDWAFLKWKTAVRLDEKISAEWKSILKRVISQKEVYNWFHDFVKVINEQSIVILNEKEEEETRRPDRVVITKDGYTDIIDYKTGEEHSSSHSNQVKKYVTAYRNAGFKKVRGFIWYIYSGKIVTVDDGLTATQILYNDEKK